MAPPSLFSKPDSYRIAVVRNRKNDGIVGRLGRSAPKKYARRSVQRIVDALRDGGHTVRVIEGDRSLVSELRDFMPPQPRTGRPGGIVFNLSHGIQGETRYTHVPAMLEMAGMAYTGPTPLGHALALDKAAAAALLRQAGVRAPELRIVTDPSRIPGKLRFPLGVRPRHEPARYGSRLAGDRDELERIAAELMRRHRQDVIVEEHIQGRAFAVALLGNDPVETLPLVELDESGGKICPAPVNEEIAERIRGCARAAFWACHGRDYARIDVRLGASGEVYAVEIRTMDVLEGGGAFAVAGAAAGVSFPELIRRIVAVARERYRPGATSRPVGIGPLEVAEIESLPPGAIGIPVPGEAVSEPARR
jgi:D-alanine-D-alanine ligase